MPAQCMDTRRRGYAGVSCAAWELYLNSVEEGFL